MLAQAIDLIVGAQAGDPAVTESMLADAIEVVVAETEKTYTSSVDMYVDAREADPWDADEEMYSSLLRLVRERIAKGELPSLAGQRWRLLDIGTGYGRDLLRFNAEPDIDAFGLENSRGFFSRLQEMESEGCFRNGGIFFGDMRAIDMVDDSSFHCVRSHATLHHLPVVGLDLGADAAVSEAARILSNGGVFCVTVKQGDGLAAVDTKEQLGSRFYQLYTPELLEALLSRHAFSLESMDELVEPRQTGDVQWIFALAIAHKGG